MNKHIIITRRILEEIQHFKKMAENNDQVDVISTIVENKNCGIFITQENGRIVNIDCLAVAITKSNEFFCLDFNFRHRYFDLSQVV